MSGRKLAFVGGILILCQVLSFLVGAIFAPSPNNSEQLLAVKCHDADGPGYGSERNDNKWFTPRVKGGCISIDKIAETAESVDLTADNVVFAFQMPLPKQGMNIDYSRWQQNLIGVLTTDIEYQGEEGGHEEQMESRVSVWIDARLGYRNKGDPEDQWTLYAKSFEARNLDCSIDEDKKIDGYYYNCSMLPLFDLGALHHDYYLLNIRLPTVYLDTQNNPIHVNEGLGKLVDLWLVAINQNGGFTQIWVTMKTIFFPVIVAELVWFWRRVTMLTRQPTLLEKMLFSLGLALTFLNLPLEYCTLVYEMPWINLFNDIKQGVFYANLLVFWLIFAGEHLIGEGSEGEPPQGLLGYWKNLAVVLFGCLCLFVFDMCERGVQLQNPFFSIWVTDLGTNLALGFIILAGISAGLYFLFLCYIIRKVFATISSRSATFSAMSSIRRLHYQGIVWRFKFLMLATVLTAALTVIGFIIGQVAEGAYKWDEDLGESLQYTSGFMTGVYGLWNIYIFGLIFLYAPSHKHWGDEDNLSTGEEVEFDVRGPTAASEPSEMSSLTDFIRHQAQD